MTLNLDTLGLSATVTAQGISAPDYQTILSTITGYFQQIYGSDAYLDPDSKDGQMIALVALAIHDANNTAVAVYRSFSPTTALGDALSSNVKINGITRRLATNSTVDLVLAGTIGTTIINGTVRDSNGVIWNLPIVVVIGTDGTAVATATCASTGAVVALPHSVTQINTPTRGWMTVTNHLAATVGVAEETDAELRIRQSQSVALASLTPFDAVDGAIANISGVIRHKLLENDTGSVDSNGLPAHSLCAIVDGGDLTEIAQTIRKKKTPGVSTFGNTSVTINDAYGNPLTINFSRPVLIQIYVEIELKVFFGYTNPVGDGVKKSISDYINNLDIGDDVLLSRLYSPANLTAGEDNSDSQYYDILSLRIGVAGNTPSVSNVNISYDELAFCDAGTIKLTVTQ
ncbi:hypothetical protein F9C28_17480 [Shimwellia pseudoproteus]|uniref:baseplate J/gp47 family protein n=1 Tax=Shimwellia pseudoproteus TaxID=570012 RepID=UPI0018ECABC3|nr:baseplate J/gp47 family protein [Shimwellia pseudoproteus]MBJ3816654.1 hypothetical protein [Shimwellia pseudoproteus]